MIKAVHFKSFLKWLKLFTYISATVLLITNNNFDKLTYLIPLALLLFLINYSRDYYLVEGQKPIQYVWASIILEMILIILVGFLSENDINILFFFVFISSIVIIYPFLYSVPPAIVFIVTGFFIYAGKDGSTSLIESIISLTFSYGVSTVFVMGMSYIVKMQIREKEKLARINSELEQAYKRLIDNSAAAHQLTIETERTRMAREIHDTLAHTLTTLIVQLEACKKLASLDPGRLPGELEKAQELSRSGFNDVKRSIKALRPRVMENKSFIASIVSIINETMESTKVQISLHNFLTPDIKLPSQIEIALFRTLQESITNSIRHGQATDIEITIEQKSNQLSLSIEDNGMGCINIKKGYGMKGIMERIDSLNGKVEFSNTEDKGFKTRVCIPYEVV
jgi:signal transduction histidine kinase